MANSPTLAFQIGGDKYEVRLGDLTPRDARDFRSAVGVPLIKAVTSDSTDLDVIAGLVWLVRRRTSHQLRFEQVLDSFTYDDFESSPSATATSVEASEDPPPSGGHSEG